MPRARPNRYTHAMLRADLRRIMRRLRADADERGELRYPADDDLAALCALARIAHAADSLIDWHIVGARRRERRLPDGTIDPGKPVAWERIGDALNITGQAAGKRARARRLAITPPPVMTPERYQQLVAEGLRLAAHRGRGRR
ncbi:hypothetical protein IU510_29735 [Nocardia cyriacigeorgica]|uniref:hypothetical protein n=1 Tax=Nocardia cyriacigeorgica TaxID=135487 RepID=UPI0018938F11|nr:hypothetical protein [Nocardia cyriacigeorgica]MBF6102202.1 hypothetical protein [Nocardia cyriacigeorgica]MBF6347359.1 hypothetical protein [Nocardia cyriacigeorgica]